MHRVVFGDNQFFGVNHMSEEKARAQMIRFQDDQAVIDVLDIAYEAGIRVFMCTTHERIVGICDYIRARPEQYRDFEFHPCMPYAHKYANAVTDHGIVDALRLFLPTDGALSALVKSGMAAATKDVQGIAQLLIDAEMKMFRGLKTPVIWLQNVVTDLLLGLGLYEAFNYFANHIRERYQAEPGFITMNMPRLLDVLERQGIENPIICANFNKIGFRMCPNVVSYERLVATRHFRPVAMSVLASGAISPREGIEYVCRQKNIRSIVFGASSRSNIFETKRLIDDLSLLHEGASGAAVTSA